ncbi:MAG: manganese-dependent inorganic pyrophosphatase [Patescibacteria group bacterium]
MTQILVSGAIHPDIDAFACAIAYVNYLNQLEARHNHNNNKYEAKFNDLGHIETNFVAQKLGFKVELIDPQVKYDGFILVDASGRDGLPSIFEAEKVLEVIDHRLFPDYDYFPNAQFRIEPVGAAATQIAEFYYFNHAVKLSPEIATLLLCAIYSNTNNFLADTTTFRDFRMKNWLAQNASQPELPDQMFKYKTDYILNNLEEVLVSDSKVVKLSNATSFDFLQLEMANGNLVADNLELPIILEKVSSVPDYFLAIQNISTAKTIILTNKIDLLYKLKQTGLQINESANYFELDAIYMRKTLIQKLK